VRRADRMLKAASLAQGIGGARVIGAGRLRAVASALGVASALATGASFGASLSAASVADTALEETAPTVAPNALQVRIDRAAPGETIEVGPDLSFSPIRVDKSVRLVAKGRVVIDGGGVGDVVVISAPNVEFRGFTVVRSGSDLDTEDCGIRVLAGGATIEDNTLDDVLFGIDLKSAPDSVVRGNKIGAKRLDEARRGDGLRLWRSDRALIERNHIIEGRDAILWYSTDVTVRDNLIERSRYGIHLMYSHKVVMERNTVRHNSVGVYFMYSHSLELRENRLEFNRGPSGYGLGLKETDRFVIESNLFVGNRAGIYIDGSPFTRAAPGMFRHNTIAWNDIGIALLPAVRGNVFTENNFIDNMEQVAVLGRGELRGNDFALDDRGNHWSDYTGYDRDRDGLGDYDHESSRYFESLMDREPKLRLFLLGPAEQAVEFVARALPSIRPEPKFYDPAPLMEAVPVPQSLRTVQSTRSLAGVAFALVACGLSIVLVGRFGQGVAR